MSKLDEHVKWGTHEIKRGKSLPQIERELIKEGDKGLSREDRLRALAKIERAGKIEEAKRFEKEKSRQSGKEQPKKKSSIWAAMFVVILIAIMVFLLNYSGIIALF